MKCNEDFVYCLQAEIYPKSIFLMKRYVLFLLLFLFAQTVQSQSVFAPSGAQWFYALSADSTALHCYNAGDTFLQGKTAQIIKQEVLLPSSYPMNPYYVQTLYVYSALDTTFVFNNLFGRYTPLYIFNAQEGDSICLPIPPLDGWAEYVFHTTDSNFCFVIDSVRTVLYDTAWLKTFYTRGFQRGNNVELNWSHGGYYPSLGAYAERIGGLVSSIIPYCEDGCSFILSGSIYPDTIRCYHDDDYAIKVVSGDCGNYGINTSVNDIEKVGTVIYPNPATDYIYINNAQNYKLNTISLYATDGKLVKSWQGLSDNKLSVADVVSGLYYLHIVFQNHFIETKKLLIQKK